jgi:hypothetical protein
MLAAYTDNNPISEKYTIIKVYLIKCVKVDSVMSSPNLIKI